MPNYSFNMMPKTMKISAQCFIAALLGCIVSNQVSAQSPTLLKDINQIRVNSNPRGMTLSGTSVFFSVDDQVHGRELWKTNGSSAGTTLVMDIDPSGSSNPGNFCNVNGTVYFTATRPSEGTELWKTNGTTAGTVLVSDLLPGTSSSNITQLTACNGKVFFSAIKRNGAFNELKLYVSDASGTRVLDQVSNLNGNISVPQNLTAVGNTLYFSANSNLIGTELFKTDGNTVQSVLNINPVGSSAPRNFINVSGTLFFSANDGPNGRQLWKSLGASTQRVSSLQTMGVPGAEIAEIANVVGTVFFSAPVGLLAIGNQIFKVNSAATGTTQINVVVAESLTAAGGKLFFTQSPSAGNPNLSFINANSTTVNVLKDFPRNTGTDSGMPRQLIAATGYLYFTAGTTANGRELWRSNGMSLGTEMVQDFVAGAESAGVSDMCISGHDVYFASNGSNGNELRRSDGTVGNIITVRNITHAGSAPTGFTKFGSFTYFAADDGVNGRELWRTDGTGAGTQLFKNINNAAGASSSPDNFMVITANNGVATLFFVANNGNQGRELYKSDGTANGTVRISDFPGLGGIANLTNVNGVLHLTAPSGLSSGDQIFKTNSSLTSVVPTGGSMSNANNLVANGSTLFFTQSPQIGGPQLCKLVNGTTTIIKTFAMIPGGQNPVPQQLTVIASRLFFTAADATYGRELWKSDGTSGGTMRISDIAPDAGDAGIGNMTNFKDTLHFTAFSGTSLGNRIFKTNAAVNGVETTGGSHVQADNLVALGTKLYFTQQSHTSDFGPSLCKLEKGVTKLLKEFALITDGQYPGALQLTAVGNKLYFTAATAVNGREIWKSDGTVNGTNMVANMRAGVGNANVLTMKLSGSDLFISLNTLEFGQEPYKITNAAPLQEDDADDRNAPAEMTQIESIVVPEIKVYPNPATNFISVDLPDNDLTGSLSLLTVSGQLISEVQAIAGETQVRMDVQDLPRGLYLIRWVQSDTQVVVKKLIVQ